MPKAVIFDFDGVITDTMTMHLQAWQKSYVNHFNVELQFPKRLIGMATIAISQILCREQNRLDLIDSLVEEKRAIVTRLANQPIPLLPGVEEYINYLQTKKIPFGICSNAPRDFIFQILKHHKLGNFLIHGIEDAPKPKPAPDSYIKTAIELGLNPEDFSEIYIYEDSFHGLHAAKAAGMIAIGLTTYHTEKELIHHGASQVFKNLEESLNHVCNNNC